MTEPKSNLFIFQKTKWTCVSLSICNHRERKMGNMPNQIKLLFVLKFVFENTFAKFVFLCETLKPNMHVKQK